MSARCSWCGAVLISLIAPVVAGEPSPPAEVSIRVDQAAHSVTRALWRGEVVRGLLLVRSGLNVVDRRLAPGGYTRPRYHLRSPLVNPVVVAGFAVGGFVVGPIAGNGVVARIRDLSSLGRDTAFKSAGWRADFSARKPTILGAAASPRIAIGGWTFAPTAWVVVGRKIARAIGTGLALETDTLTVEIGGWRTNLASSRAGEPRDRRWWLHRAIPRAQYTTGYARLALLVPFRSGAELQVQTTQIGQAARAARPVWLHRVDIAFASGEFELTANGIAAHYDMRGLEGTAVAKLRRADVRLERRFGVNRGTIVRLRPKAVLDIDTALDARRRRSAKVALALSNLNLGVWRFALNAGVQNDTKGTADTFGTVVRVAPLPWLELTARLRHHGRRGSNAKLTLKTTTDAVTFAVDAAWAWKPRRSNRATNVAERGTWSVGADLEAAIGRRAVARVRGTTALPFAPGSWKLQVTLTTRFGRRPSAGYSPRM